MTTPVDRDTPRTGISAVLMAGDARESAVLDLAAVLEGLVSAGFEIIVVTPATTTTEPLADLRARAPGLPVRLIVGESVAAGCEAAVFELILVSAPDGRFDIRELNRLFEAIEQGADVAVGYRPKRTDCLFRQLERFGWPRGLDWAYCLFPRWICTHLAEPERALASLLSLVRRKGFRVAEVPVRHQPPTLGVPLSVGSRAA